MQNGLSKPRPRSRTMRLVGYLLGFVVSALASPSFAADATTSCCNVIELRQYTLHPGRRETFIQLFDSTFADPLDATGMTVIGQFRDLDRPDRFVWLRGFESMDARAKELAAFYDGGLWHTHSGEANASIDDSDNVLLLEPASPSLGFKAIRPRSLAGVVEQKTGLIVATLYYTKPESLATFATFLYRSLRARAKAAGARTLAVYVTSTQTNNYPRPPIRLGEHIVVWFTGFENPDVYAAYLGQLQTDQRWSQELWPAAREHLTREPEVLRLTPTSGSRLRG